MASGFLVDSIYKSIRAQWKNSFRLLDSDQLIIVIIVFFITLIITFIMNLGRGPNQMEFSAIGIQFNIDTKDWRLSWKEINMVSLANRGPWRIGDTKGHILEIWPYGFSPKSRKILIEKLQDYYEENQGKSDYKSA